MKGVIVNCFEELVITKFGKDKLMKIRKLSQIKEGTIFLAHQDVEDTIVLMLIQSYCTEIAITMKDFSLLFGDYWVNHFSQRIYSHYYTSSKNSREFLLSMNDLHKSVTEKIPGARPPQFFFQNINEKTIGITYKSHRGLIELLIGLIHGVGNYYKEKLIVEKESETQLKVHFS